MATYQELADFADQALSALTEANSKRDLAAYRVWNAATKLGFMSAQAFFETDGVHKSAADAIRADHAKVQTALKEAEAAAPAQEPDIMQVMMGEMRGLMGKIGELVAGMEVHAAMKAGQEAVKPEEGAEEKAEETKPEAEA